MSEKKNILWSSDFDLDDWADFLAEDYPGLSDTEAYELVAEMNSDYLTDTRMQLDINAGEPIIAIADIGRWCGRVSGYKIIESGKISDCLFSTCSGGSLCTWYVNDAGDLCLDESHHDGSNYVRYRAFRPETDEDQRDELCSKIYCGTVTEADIAAVTSPLGGLISEVYGWDELPDICVPQLQGRLAYA